MGGIFISIDKCVPAQGGKPAPIGYLSSGISFPVSLPVSFPVSFPVWRKATSSKREILNNVLADNLNETLQPDATAMDQQLTMDLYSQAEQSLIYASGESRDTMSGNADTSAVERKKKITTGSATK